MIVFLKIKKIAITIKTINGDVGLFKNCLFQPPPLRADNTWYQKTPLNPETPINTMKKDTIPEKIDHLN